jgi:hypothetical protein
MSFGQHLRGLHQGAGLPRAVLARRAAVPASNLRNWEDRRGFPYPPALLLLPGALRIPVEWFAQGWTTPQKTSRRRHRKGKGVKEKMYR